MIRTNGRPCWNGPSCRFYAQGRCHFYHPPEHRSGLTINHTSSILSRLVRQQRQKKQRERRELRANQFQRRLQAIRTQIRNRNINTVSLLSNSSSNPSRPQRERTIQDLFGFLSLEREVPASSTSTQALSSRIRDYSSLVKQEEDQPQLEENIKWFFQKNVNLKYDESMKQKFEQCSICCSEYQKDQKIFVLFCHHNFHKDCIKKWFTMNTVCPFCRKDFRKHEQYSQYDKAYMSKIQKPKTSSLFQSIYSTYRGTQLQNIWDQVSQDQDFGNVNINNPDDLDDYDDYDEYQFMDDDNEW